MQIDQNTKNSFEDLGDKVVIYDELGSSVIYNLFDDLTELEEGNFKKHFRVVNDTEVHGDPNEDYYQSVTFIRLIERLSDGNLFGYIYAQQITKNGETFVEANGDEYGFEYETPYGFDFDEDYYPETFVFLPVKPFTMTGYEIVQPVVYDDEEL